MKVALLILAGLTAAGGVFTAGMVLLASGNGASAPIWPELLVTIGGAAAVVGAICI